MSRQSTISVVPQRGIAKPPSSAKDLVFPRILSITVLAASALLMSACASTTDFNTRYITDTPVKPAHTVLLVGRTPESNDREKWENACADVLDNRKIELIRSNTALPLWYEAGNDHLLNWASRNNVDAIIIGELTGLLLAPPQIPANNFMQSERAIGEDNIGASTWSFFIGRKEKEIPMPPDIHEVEFQMITTEGKMLWNSMALTHEANDLAAIARSQCRALKHDLNGLRLIP